MCFFPGAVLRGKMRCFRAAQGRAEEASERALKTVVPSTLRFSLIYPHQTASDVFFKEASTRQMPLFVTRNRCRRVVFETLFCLKRSI